MKRPPEDLAAKIRAVSDQFLGTGMAVTVDDVAIAADVPRATLYYYFAGRDDLVNFFLTDHLDRVAAVIPAAAASGGSVIERIEATLRAILRALADQAALCIELPVVLTQTGDFTGVVATTERVMLAPLRELLIEGRATGDLKVVDLDVAVQSLLGAVFFTAMLQTTAIGSFDDVAVGDALIPQLIGGLADV